MIKNGAKLEEFYRKLMEEENIPPKKAFAIFDDLYNEAKKLGVISRENILDGIEVDIKIANALKSLNDRKTA